MDLWAPLKALPPVAHPPEMRAAVLVPIYEDGADLRLIFTRRHADLPTHAGDVVFPGGMVEEGDPGPEETALREAWEEIGLPPENVEIIGGLEPVTTRVLDLVIVPVVGRVQRPADLRPSPTEVEVVIEPRIADLLDESSWRRGMWGGHEIWFRPFPEGMLWGATARMVRGLLTYFRG